MRRQRELICIVCGNEFKGSASAITCGGACRFELARLKEANKRPQFFLVAKGKGQKVPDLNAPKRLKFKKGEKKKKERPENLESAIDYKIPDEAAYDGKKTDFAGLDEMGQTEKVVAKELTLLEKLNHNNKINEQIRLESKKEGSPGVHPRMFKLKQDDIIAELKKQLL